MTRLARLAKQLSNWAAAEGWKVDQQQLPITEELLGTYTVPQLTIHLARGDILVTPVALNVTGGDGRVDIEAIPTLARVKMLGTDGGWGL